MKPELQKLLKDEQRHLKQQDGPGFVHPMLATLTRKHFNHPDWIFERKFDGERCLALRRNGEVELYSRNHKRLEAHYPEIAEALTEKGPDLALDGEVVAFEQGVTSFSLLQGRMQIKDPQKARDSGVSVYYYAFDILHYDGWDTSGLSQRQRKRLLKGALEWSDPLRYATHRNENGLEFFEQACGNGWEGLIAKRADAAYENERSRHWLKFKCVSRQEFVIGGYTPPEGARISFGALLLGYYQQGKLRYAGKVGTGFDRETLQGLGGRLKEMISEEPYFVDENLPQDAHWVEPRLVCEVGFSEWTRAGRLRHPRYLGLREDKDPREVHKER